jgi:hypothetical protein
MNPDDFANPTARETTQALALFNFPPTHLVNTPPRSPDREETERLGYLNVDVNLIDMRAFCQLWFSPDNSVHGDDENEEDQEVEEPNDDRLDEVADSPPPPSLFLNDSAHTASQIRASKFVPVGQ